MQGSDSEAPIIEGTLVTDESEIKAMYRAATPTLKPLEAGGVLTLANLHALVKKNKNIIDMNIGGEMIYRPPSSYGNPRMLAASIPSHTEHHYVFDIESMGLRPDLIHMAVLMTIDGNDHQFFRSDNGPKATWDDIVQYFYFLLFAHKKTKVWAHYGASFDYVGLADHIGCTYGKVIEVEVENNNGESEAVEWKVEVWGNRHRLVLKVKGEGQKNRIDFDDSSYHMPARLSALGAKGTTPVQYTHPDDWLQEKYGIDYTHQDALKTWYDYIDDEAIGYCIQDCKVLASALTLWNKFWVEQFELNALDYMTSSKLALHGCIKKAALPVTLAKGKVWYFVKYPQNKFNRPKNGASVWSKFTGVPRALGGKKAEGPDDLEREGKMPDLMLAPLAKNGTYAIAPAGWSAPGRYVELFDMVATGGRAEIFANVTNDGMRPFVIDLNSSYPSVNVQHQFTDPRFLVDSDDEILGKKDILEFLRGKTSTDGNKLPGRGGMFKVEIDGINNAIIKKFPVTWVRLSSECGVEGKRLAFVDWEGILNTWMTGEELAYLLEFVSDDHFVRIIKSISSNLIPSTHSPNSIFSGELFAVRKDHEKKAKALKDSDPEQANVNRMFALFAKLANNAGSFGIFSETHCDTERIVYDENGDLPQLKLDAMVVVQKLIEIDPLWSALTDPENRKEWKVLLDPELAALEPARFYIKKAALFAQQWGIDFWRPASTFNVTSNDGSTHEITEVPVSRFLAPHAIKCWAAQITAHARVKLHRAIVAASQAGYQVCYVDTDSLHLGVPNNVSNGEVTENLVKKGVPIGDGLGDWKIEEVGGDKGISPGKAVKGYYISPKVYAYVNKDDEVVHTVCKGIPAAYSVMRAAMSSISAHPSKIGCKLGLRTSRVESRDALANVNKTAKRNYTFIEGIYDSMPIVIKNPFAEDLLTIDGKKYNQDLDGKTYLNIIANQVASGNTQGVNAALKAYMQCTFRGKTIKELRNIISTLKDEIEKSKDEVIVDSNVISMMVNRRFRSYSIADKLPDVLRADAEFDSAPLDM